MPVVSDFSIVNATSVLVSGGAAFTRAFDTSGRHNSVALLDVSLLGGYRAADSAMSYQILLNGVHLSTPMSRRWTDHSLIVLDRLAIQIPVSRLISGVNTLQVKPGYEAASDYCFVGTTVVHFHQEA